MIGAIMNKILFALLGNKISLTSSLKPSAKGCKTPKTPITLGPLRR
jgi:hypothetical protein